MLIQDRINAFAKLGTTLAEKLGNGSLEATINRAYNENKWFTPENIQYALQNIIKNYLNEGKIKRWISAYQIPENHVPLKIGLVPAGNIPLVGWHDIMCILISGNGAQIKLSAKDKALTELLLKELTAIAPEFERHIEDVNQLKGFDAIIATGSNNTSRYFEYYFGKYPHIIRTNRNSAAILEGNETEEDMHNLGKDIFTYFGLGCRNVSMLYVPEGYNFEKMFTFFQVWDWLFNNFKYRNNYDYNKSLFLLNKEPHLDNGFLLLKESAQPASAVSTLHYSYYSSLEQLHETIRQQRDKFQCLVGKQDMSYSEIPFGKSQEPELWDYADNVDTMEFLLGSQLVISRKS